MRYSFTRLAVPFLVALFSCTALFSVGCKTKTDGVRSSYLYQTADTNGTTEQVVDAAQTVLTNYELTDVSGKSDKLKGEAKGVMVDGTKVWVTTERVTDTTTSTSVQVGKLGDNSLGQEILGKIKLELANK